MSLRSDPNSQPARPPGFSGAPLDALASQRFHRQRLENLGVLALGTAHELKNLLSPLILGAELAALELDPTHPAQAPMATVLGVAKRARELVQRFADYGSLHAGELRPFALDQIVAEVVALLRPTLPSRGRIRAVITPGLPWILADRIHAHQVVTNLLINAAEALKPGVGEIEISLAAAQILTPRGDDPLQPKPGDYVRLTVQDDGVGMDEATRRRIFDEFFTTKSPGRGTGLGLAIVRQIVADHGGGLAVESAPGRGTTFHVYWPVAPARSSAAQPS